MFCQVEPEQVIAVHNVASTYHVPLLLEKQGMIKTISEILNLDEVTKSPQVVLKGEKTWKDWRAMTSSQDRSYEDVNIALVGKYTSFKDSYLSVTKSLEHASMRCGKKLNIIWVESTDLEDETRSKNPAAHHKAWHQVCTAQGILVPGGFGNRGHEGMIKAAQWAREHQIPYLGVCLGMQIAVIEYARHKCDLPDADSFELDVAKKSQNHVIISMPDVDQVHLGETMRLGSKATVFQPGSEWSKLRKLYGSKTSILERHRHRFEVSPEYIEKLTAGGLEFIGKDDKGERMEVIELKDHKWFVGVQFHPEYLSRVLGPSIPYLGFVAASSGCLEKITLEVAGNGVAGVDGGKEVSI